MRPVGARHGVPPLQGGRCAWPRHPGLHPGLSPDGLSGLIAAGVFVFSFLALSLGRAAEVPADLKLTGDWQVKVTVSGARPAEATLSIAPPKILTVSAEKYDSLPVFNPKAGGWVRGAQLRPVRAQETTTAGLLDPDSLVLRAGPGADAATFRKGTDYEADQTWGTVGRLAMGGIKEGQPVFASYRHALLRLDAVVLTQDGRIELREGTPRAAAPLPPEIKAGERRLANIWLPGRIAKLAPEHLFPCWRRLIPSRRSPAPPSPSTACPRR